MFKEKTFDVCLWNYKGYGIRKGSPDFHNMNEEAERIIKFLNEKENYKNIGLYGYSLGGSVATNLGNSFKNINLLICDRTFSSLENIVRSRFDYSFFKILLKFFMINDTSNHDYYFDIVNNIDKVIICDYNDEVIHIDSSLKRGIEFKIKQEMLLNEISVINQKYNRVQLNNIKNYNDKFNNLKTNFSNNFSDLIRNKNIFTNIEYENFKSDFKKTLDFMNEKEILKYGSICFSDQNNEEFKEFDRKEDDSILNKSKSNNNETIINIKNVLKEFFRYYARERKLQNLFNCFSLERDYNIIDNYLNVIFLFFK